MERDRDTSEGLFGTFDGPNDPGSEDTEYTPSSPTEVPSFFSREAPAPSTAPPVDPGQPTDSMSAFITKTMAAVTDQDEPLNDDNLLPPAPRTSPKSVSPRPS